MSEAEATGSSPAGSIDDSSGQPTELDAPPLEQSIEPDSSPPSRPEADVGTATDAAAGDDPVEEPWRKRIWFVRLPPPEQVSSGALQATLDSLMEQVKLLNTSAAVKRTEKDHVQKLQKQARQQLIICKENLQQKEEQLRPLREARDHQNKARDALRSAGGDLTVRSEEELDAKLAELHRQQQHESLTANEEKRVLQTIKHLQGSREKVREYAAKANTLASARTAMTNLQGDMKQLEAERKALVDERAVQTKITDKYWNEMQELDRQINDIYAERGRIKEQQDEVFAELRAHRQLQRDRNSTYAANRAFSQQVRQVLRSGRSDRLDEARKMCNQQMDEAIARLSTDTDFRAEYQALWEQYKPRKLDLPLASVPEGKQGEPQQQPSRSKATDIVSRALEHAAQTLAKTRSEGNLHASASAPATSSGTTITLPSSNPPSTSQPSGNGSFPKPASSRVKSTPAKPAVVPVAATQHADANGNASDHQAPKATSKGRRFESEDFEVPVSLLKNQAPVDEEAVKAQAREHNLAAAREAEARKQRRLKEKERKKARAQEAKSRAAAPAEPAANGNHAAAAPPEDPLEPTMPSQEFLMAAAMEAKEPSAQKRKAPGKGPKVVPSSGPRARPPVRKKGALRFVKEYQVYLAVAGFGVVAAAVAAYLVHTGNSYFG